jgi:hypothetical protein
MCRISLEPDSCVRQTGNAFLKYGMRPLLVSKFVPGLNAVAAPLAGNFKAPYRVFPLYDGAGALIRSGAYLALGYIYSRQLEAILNFTSRMGSKSHTLRGSPACTLDRPEFPATTPVSPSIEVAKITAEEPQDRLNAGEDLVVVDLRSGLSESSVLIPGAIRISLEDLTARSQEVPRGREIILFCS